MLGLWLAALLTAQGPGERVALVVYPGSAEERVDAQAIRGVLDRILEHRQGLLGIAGSDSARNAALVRVRECGSDRECLGARLGEQGIRFALLVGLHTREVPGLVTVGLLDTTAKGELLDQRLVEVGADPPQILDAIAESFFQALQRTPARSVGLLWIDKSPASAEVLIEGPGSWREPSGVYRLLPGEHRLRIRAEGFVEERRSLIIEPDRDQREQVVLEADRDLLSRPWLWVLVGAGVLGAGLAIWRLEPNNDRICFQGSGGACR